MAIDVRAYRTRCLCGLFDSDPIGPAQDTEERKTIRYGGRRVMQRSAKPRIRVRLPAVPPVLMLPGTPRERTYQWPGDP